MSNSSEKDARLVATKLEQFRTTFRSIFPNAKFTSAIPTNVVVFKSSGSYKPYKPKRGDGKVDEWIAGYFQAGEDVNYITLSTEGEKEDTFGTIFHEYVHSLLNTTFGKSQVPPWFNEGLAEYYQTFAILDDQKVQLGRLQDNHLLLLQQTKLIPLKDFFAITNYSLHRNGNHSRSIFYAQAWALIHFLIQGNGGSNVEGLGKFLNQVMNKVEPEKAFQASFGSDYVTMEKALKKYVEQRTFRGTTVTFKEKLVFDNQFTVAPINEATANAYLGDLLYHTHEYPAAEAHLQKALQLEPNLSMAHTSLGLVKMRQRDFATAKRHLEHAIADDQKNHFAHYNYAYVLSRESMDEFGYVRSYPPEVAKKMKDAFRRSIELNPEFSESYRMLAFVLMIENSDLDEAIAVLKKGRSFQPGNEHYALLMAQIYLRQDKYNEAKALAESLAKTSDDEAMRRNAEQISSTIAQYEEAKRNSELVVSVDGVPNRGRPVFVKRSTMSEEEVAKLERDREIRNLNLAIGGTDEGEKRIVGKIAKIDCAGGEVVYDVVAEGAKMRLTSKDFQSLDLQVLHEGTSDFSVGCEANVANELVVITYRPTASKNTLTALHFVPTDFRLMTREEIASAPNLIVEGGPPSDTGRNAQIAAGQMADLEKRREQMMMQQLERSLRKPLDGEVRFMGGLEKIECTSKEQFFIFRNAAGTLKLKAPTAADQLTIRTFTPDAGGMQFGCGSSYPTLQAIVTYRPNQDKKGKNAGDLVALEYVPKSYQLPATN